MTDIELETTAAAVRTVLCQRLQAASDSRGTWSALYGRCPRHGPRLAAPARSESAVRGKGSSASTLQSPSATPNIGGTALSVHWLWH